MSGLVSHKFIVEVHVPQEWVGKYHSDTTPQEIHELLRNRVERELGMNMHEDFKIIVRGTIKENQ